MKTNYKILWIDDEHQYVRGDRRSINEFLHEHGITLEVQPITVTPDKCPTTDPTFNDAVSDLELDMVFIDYNMPEQGDLIIQHIRKDLHHYYLPILFYTSDNNAQAMLQKSILQVNTLETEASRIADGIYFCDRDHIFEKAKLILTSLLRKEARPQQGRGLLMDRVSEIDAKLLKAISKFWPDVPDEKKPELVMTVKSRVSSSLSRATKIVEDIETKNYEEILQYFKDDIRRWDTSSRAIILRSILEIINADDPKAQTLLKFYNNDSGQPKALMLLRNDYAHKSSEDLAANHDDAQCVYIRTESRKHIENLDAILAS